MNFSFPRPFNARYILETAKVFCLLLAIFLIGCQSTAAGKPGKQDNAEQPGQSFSGQGSGEVLLDAWQGPALLHLSAAEGALPFRVLAASGLDFQVLVESERSVDEYRGIALAPGASMQLRIEGDRVWKLEVLPLQDQSFDVLQVPGTYTAQGNSVVFIEGKHSVATFHTDDSESFEAWAIGESQQWERLKITAQGDYKGKSVLPSQTRVIITSASGPWSVEILEPCCEKDW